MILNKLDFGTEFLFQIFNFKLGINLYTCLFFSFFLFFIGFVGFINNSRNLLLFLMCLELMFLSINASLVAVSVFTNSPLGQIYSLLLLGIAAAEAAIGLSLLVVCYRVTYTVHIKILSTLRG